MANAAAGKSSANNSTIDELNSDGVKKPDRAFIACGCFYDGPVT